LQSYLLITDIDDTPVDAETSAPISSNWAFDHDVATTHFTQASISITKSQISDFADADYATGAEGDLAATAMQDLINDTTPQLGSHLDCTNKNLTDAGTIVLGGASVVAWHSTNEVLQIGTGGSISGSNTTGESIRVGNNIYRNTSNLEKHLNDGYASSLEQNSTGQILFNVGGTELADTTVAYTTTTLLSTGVWDFGGNLDVTGQKIVSSSNGDIDIEPHGTGNVLLGNMTFDADQTIGAGQDDYVLRYDDASGLIKLESTGGGLDSARVVLETPVATTSGTSHDFTAIPDWVTEIVVIFSDVSTNGTSPVIIQIGDSGGIETTGYVGRTYQTNSSINSNYATVGGFGVTGANIAASERKGTVVLSLIDPATNTWVASIDTITGLIDQHGAGNKSLTGTLDRIRLTTQGGSETFDNGKVNISYTGAGGYTGDEIVLDLSPQLGGELDAQGEDITSVGVMSMLEQAAAEADEAAHGQFWVKTATPNLPMFTNDIGEDFQLGNTGVQKVTETPTATTSGTSHDYTGIPDWVTTIVVMYTGVSTSGSSPPMIQLGDSGGIEASGYLGAAQQLASGLTSSAHSTGFELCGNWSSSYVFHGMTTLRRESAASNVWTVESSIAFSAGGAYMGVCSGSKALTATLDRIRLTTIGGSDTFDAGEFNITYSGDHASDPATGVNIQVWAAITGTGTPAADASLGVDSITDIAAGTYEVDFTTAFSDAHYVTVANCGQAVDNANNEVIVTTAGNNYATTEVRVRASTGGGSSPDVVEMNVMITSAD